MATALVTKKIKFEAAHRLNSNELSEKENLDLYGKCNNLHGHNYCLEVTIAGEIDPKTGMVVDFTSLKKLLNNVIKTKFDHKNIDLDIPEFDNLVSTAENIAVVCWNLLKEVDMPGKLEKVTLHETENNSTEYYGE